MSGGGGKGIAGRVIHGLLVVLAFALLGFVLYRNRRDIAELASRPIHAGLIGPAIACYLLALFSTFVRWYWLVKVIEPRFSFGATVLLGFIGNVFNLVIPGAVGGDVIKAAYLSRMHIRRTQAIASMVIDRILGLLGLFILAGTAGLFAWSQAPGAVRRLIVAAWLALGLGLIVLAAIFLQVITRWFPGMRQRKGKLGLVLSEIRVMSATYRGRLDVVTAATLISVANHALNVISFYLVGLTLYPVLPTTLAQHFLLVPLVLFTMAVPLPFGALGLSEGVGQEVLKLVGHPNGALAMFGFRLVLYCGAVIGALIYLVKLREVRELSAAAGLEAAE